MATIVTFVTSGSDETISVRVTPVDEGTPVSVSLNTPFDITSYLVDNMPWELAPFISVSSETDVTELFDVSSSTWPISFSSVMAPPGITQFRANLSAALNDGGTHEVVIETSGAATVVSPYNRVYIVDSEIISEFANIPAIVPSSPETTNERDNTDYVIALLSIPFKLPDDISDGVSNIVLGSLNTEISAPVANADLLRVPIGEIVVSSLQNNSLDYVSTEYVLVLPFLPDEITLNPEWVVGKTLSVEYMVDVYSGDITINVYNGGEVPIVSTKSSVGRTIPFRMNSNLNSEIGNIQGANNETFTAYIRKSTQVTTDGDFSNMVSDENSLGNFEGYVRVEFVELNSHATLSEQQQIKSILSGGVIINE